MEYRDPTLKFSCQTFQNISFKHGSFVITLLPHNHFSASTKTFGRSQDCYFKIVDLDLRTNHAC